VSSNSSANHEEHANSRHKQVTYVVRDWGT